MPISYVRHVIVRKPIRTIIEILRPYKNKAVRFLLIPPTLLVVVLVIFALAISFLMGFLHYGVIKGEIGKSPRVSEGWH